jgi:hypothetical protein
VGRADKMRDEVLLEELGEIKDLLRELIEELKHPGKSENDELKHLLVLSIDAINSEVSYPDTDLIKKIEKAL